MYVYIYIKVLLKQIYFSLTNILRFFFSGKCVLNNDEY